MNPKLSLSDGELADKFSKVKVLVVGDVMLDQYWWGTVERISPEAPVPVVRLSNTTASPGGAANVAANVAGLGASAMLVGAIGSDDEGKRLLDILNKNLVSTDHLLLIDRATSIKTRVVAHNQHVVRVDRETNTPLADIDEETIIRSIESLVSKCSIVILSDYAKGTLTKRIISATVAAAKNAQIPVLADPKGQDFTKYTGVSILTPNKREAVIACGLDDSFENVVREAGCRLLTELELDAVLVTEGEHGMTLFERENEPSQVKAQAHEIFDVTGAGDTVIAALGVALASGCSRSQSMQIANISAGLVVEQVGTTAISIGQLLEKLNGDAGSLM